MSKTGLRQWHGWKLPDYILLKSNDCTLLSGYLTAPTSSSKFIINVHSAHSTRVLSAPLRSSPSSSTSMANSSTHLLFSPMPTPHNMNQGGSSSSSCIIVRGPSHSPFHPLYPCADRPFLHRVRVHDISPVLFQSLIEPLSKLQSCSRIQGLGEEPSRGLSSCQYYSRTCVRFCGHDSSYVDGRSCRSISSIFRSRCREDGGGAREQG